VTASEPGRTDEAGRTWPNELELAVLDRLAEQEPSLRPSLEGLDVLSREFTHVCSFTTFHRREARTGALELWAVALAAPIHVPGVPNGLSAVLFCTGGRPDCLEIFTHGGEHWEGAYEGFSIGETG